MVEELQQEMLTWQLLESLYKDRLVTQAKVEDDMMIDQIVCKIVYILCQPLRLIFFTLLFC